MLASVGGSHSVAAPHYPVKALKAFRAVPPERPCPFPYFLEMHECVEVDGDFPRGFRTESSLEDIIEEAVDSCQGSPSPPQVLLGLGDDSIFVIVQPGEEREVEESVLPVQPAREK